MATRKKPEARRAKKVVDTPSAPIVTSQESVNNVTPALVQKEHTVELVKDNKTRKGNGKASTYTIAGLRGSVKISSTLFDGEAPATLQIDWPVASEKAPKVKLTKEERAAANASKTPAQRLAEQEARLAKQTANLEARKAKLAAM